MEIILGIVGVIVVFALVQAFRTKKNLEDPIFRLKVERYVSEYAAKHGEPPPDHMMPEIYKKARKELNGS